jgi:hypothetical protein
MDLLFCFLLKKRWKWNAEFVLMKERAIRKLFVFVSSSFLFLKFSQFLPVQFELHQLNGSLLINLVFGSLLLLDFFLLQLFLNILACV